MKHNWKRIVLFSCLVIVCFVLFREVTFADVGNSFSGGSSSSGGHSFGGGSSFSGGHSYGGGSGGGGRFLFSFFPFFGGFGTVIFAFLIILLVWLLMVKKNPSGRTMGNINSYSSPGYSSNNGINEDAVIARVKENDPNFAAEPFKAYVKEVYIQVQEAWEKKEWNLIRPFESNTLFNVHNRQLQEYIDMKQTNYMNRQNIRNCMIADYRVDGEYEIMIVKLDASLLDFVLDDETGELVEGSKTQYQHRSYRLEFIRKNGVKTHEAEGISTTNCPNCGAPTEVTSSGQCEFCKSIITTGDYGWVLNNYSKW